MGELVAVEHLLRGDTEGGGQGLHPDGAGLLQPLRVGPALHLEDAGDHVQILNNHVLPFFEEHGVRVQTVLGDNGREFCGREDRHPYELVPATSRRSSNGRRRSAVNSLQLLYRVRFRNSLIARLSARSVT